MELKRIKTVRFDALVKASGTPEQVTLWTAPEENKAFMKSVGAHRVVTVVQHNVSTAKDYGLVGFVPRPNAMFLVFPRPLPYAEETKVIGIKYDAIAESEPVGPIFKPKGNRKPGIPMQEKPASRERKISRELTNRRK